MEGALGKISKNTNKNPKQVFEVDTSARSKPLSNTMSKMAELKCIENLYDSVLKLDALGRKKIPEGEEEELEQQYMLLISQIAVNEAKNELWRKMAPTENVPLRYL